MAEEREIRRPADPDPDRCHVSFLGRPAPAGMDVRVVSIPGHGELAYEPAEWAGSLVVVEEGEIELECHSGSTACLRAGSVAFFHGLGLRVIRNTGRETALLTAVSRLACIPPDPAGGAPYRRGS